MTGGPAARHVSLAAVTLMLVAAALMTVLAGAPPYTEDLWWHLAAGEHYLREGLWPATDPLLHTGRDGGPVQHEWLFGVAVALWEHALGFHGLRLLHAGLGVAVLWALWALLRRRGLTAAAAALTVSVFILLAWPRLLQLRPDLASMLGVLAVGGLLLAPAGETPSWRRVLVATTLFAVWANVHSLFLVGVNLVVAALLGVVLAMLLARGLAVPADPRLPGHGVRLAVAIAAALVAALANPRGIHQHLTFFTSSAETAVWYITDEWSHFNPLDWTANHESVSLPRWLAMNVVMLAFLMVAVWRGLRLARAPSASALREFDCVGFGLGLAALVAILVSIRFLWMAFLPLAWLLARRDAGQAQRPLPAVAAGAGTLLVLVLFARGSGVLNFAARYGPAPGDYLALGYASHKFHAEGADFLGRSGVTGRLFNGYAMGGFLGYWLAPGLRTFIDSRTEHYDYDVYLDYSAVLELRGARKGETVLDVLDRRRVDVYLGMGFPGWWRGIRTVSHLHGVEGWRLVARSYRHSVYLRTGAAGAANLERVAAFYDREGVPFDPDTGFDPGRVIAERPDWAEAHALIPRGFARLDDDTRALALALAGAWPRSVGQV